MSADDLQGLVSALFPEMGSELKVINELKNTVRELSTRSVYDFGFSEAEPSLALANALKGIVQQLAPLQELAPRRTQMDDEEMKRLRQLRASLDRPKWSGASNLMVQDDMNILNTAEDAFGASMCSTQTAEST